MQPSGDPCFPREAPTAPCPPAPARPALPLAPAVPPRTPPLLPDLILNPRRGNNKSCFKRGFRSRIGGRGRGTGHGGQDKACCSRAAGGARAERARWSALAPRRSPPHHLELAGASRDKSAALLRRAEAPAKNSPFPGSSAFPFPPAVLSVPGQGANPPRAHRHQRVGAEQSAAAGAQLAAWLPRSKEGIAFFLVLFFFYSPTLGRAGHGCREL